MVFGSIGCYKYYRFKLVNPEKLPNSFSYLLIFIIWTVHTDSLGNSLSFGVNVINKLVFHTCAELNMCWEINTSRE